MLPERSGVRPSTSNQTMHAFEPSSKKPKKEEDSAWPYRFERTSLDWIVSYTQSNGMGTALPYYFLHLYHAVVLGVQGDWPCFSSTTTKRSRKTKGRVIHHTDIAKSGLSSRTSSAPYRGPRQEGTQLPEIVWLSSQGGCYHPDPDCVSIKGRAVTKRRL